MGSYKYLVERVLCLSKGANFAYGVASGGSAAGNAANTALGTIAFGSLAGGFGSALTGGNFWQGALIGGVVAGLNHVVHRMNSPLSDDKGREDPPGKNKKGKLSVDDIRKEQK